MNSDVDFAVAAWHESDTWNLEILSDPYNLGSIINELRSHQTNGGALGLIAIDEEFFILIRVLGSQISLFISDVTCALDYEVANEFLELADLPNPEFDDEPLPGGHMDIISDLGMGHMELESLCDDSELFPDEQLEAIAKRLGFSDQFGYDADLTSFKGKISTLGDNAYNTGDDYTTKTKGFHMDINAQTIVDSITGDQVFTTGVASFSDATVVDGTATHPYNNMKTRKFTALFAGGFDGWDEFRPNRTNTDEYKIGRTGFVAGTFDTFTNVQYAELFGTSDYYAYLNGIKTFQNPEETAINILATPGIDMLNNTDLVRDAIEVVEEKRLDAIYLPTLPDIKLLNNTNPSNSEDWYYAEDIVSELENTEIDSNYTAVYYPWIQITDTDNNANLYIPPTAEVVRNMAYTDNVAYPWFATAGYNRGLVKCNKARIVLDQDARDVLYPGRINPLATYTDVGVVIWGNRNLQVKSSALDRLNIRRLLLQARRLIMSVSKRLLFDPNDTTVRNQFLSLVNPILDNIRKERGLTDFRVSVAMDVTDNDRNTLTGKIYIKPTPTLEFIELEFVVTPQNVSFDNI